MLLNNYIIIFILVVLYLLTFIIGYILGKITTKGVYDNSKPKSFFDKENNKETKFNVSIDEKKFVTEIKTDNLEKKYSDLGEIKETEETISASVDKLKSLKK